jgi:hypothetical protein
LIGFVNQPVRYGTNVFNLKAEIRMTEGRKNAEIRRSKPRFAAWKKKCSPLCRQTRNFRALALGFLSVFGLRPSAFQFNFEQGYQASTGRWIFLAFCSVPMAALIMPAMLIVPSIAAHPTAV